MNKEIVNIAFLFVSILLIQVLIFNHIALFGVAFPFVFIYFIIRMRIDMNTNLLLLLSFLIGFLVDIWSDTPGVNALGSTILAMLKRPLFYIYVPRDDRMKDIKPGINTLGISVYTKYLLTATFIFSAIVFSAEYMSFINLKDLLIMSLSSTLISFLLILGFDSLFSIKPEKK